jgi:hypothetical protein
LVSPESKRGAACKLRKRNVLPGTGSTRKVFVPGLCRVKGLAFSWKLYNVCTFFYLYLYENILMTVCGMPKYVAYIVIWNKEFQFSSKLNFVGLFSFQW